MTHGWAIEVLVPLGHVYTKRHFLVAIEDDLAARLMVQNVSILAISQFSTDTSLETLVCWYAATVRYAIRLMTASMIGRRCFVR